MINKLKTDLSSFNYKKVEKSRSEPSNVRNLPTPPTRVNEVTTTNISSNFAWSKLAPVKLALDKSLFTNSALYKSTPVKLALVNLAPVKSVFFNIAPLKLVLVKSAPVKSANSRLISNKIESLISAPTKEDLVIEEFLILIFVKSAPLNETPLISTSEKVDSRKLEPSKFAEFILLFKKLDLVIIAEMKDNRVGVKKQYVEVMLGACS